MKKVLVVAVHPDDEVLGCGGTIAKLASRGAMVSVLILGEGVTSRFAKREDGVKSSEMKALKNSIGKAAKILGVKHVFLFDLPDNKFDTVPTLEVVKLIEKVKAEVRPQAVLTHHYFDLNVDHRVTYNAVLTSFRPVSKNISEDIYSFEVPSSTEWNYPSPFRPNVFVDISGTINKKMAALSCYKNELRKFPHPRSAEAIKSIAKRWGSVSGLNAAEAFEAVRIIK